MTLTCLIPAYNEQDRITAVLQAVLDHPLIDEVLVIDDGSTDATSAVVRRSTARLITLSPNVGKTAALARGLAESSGDLILLVDADLVGLSPTHLTALITPVLSGHADISISLRDNAPTIWHLLGLDYISGERVLQKSLLTPHLDHLHTLPKFGFEVYLNSLLIQHTARIAVVRWPGVISPLKSRKYGFWVGVKGDIKMLADLSRAAGTWGLVRQVVRMRGMRV